MVDGKDKKQEMHEHHQQTEYQGNLQGVIKLRFFPFSAGHQEYLRLMSLINHCAFFMRVSSIQS